MAASGEGEPTVSAEEFRALWSWLVTWADEIEPVDQAPVSIHSRNRAAATVRHRRDAFGAPAFSLAFENYLGDQALTQKDRDNVQWRTPRRRGRSALRLAMKRLYSPGRPQSHEYRIVNLVVDGGYRDPAMVNSLLGCSRAFFDAAAIRAIRFLSEHTQPVASDAPAADSGGERARREAAGRDASRTGYLNERKASLTRQRRADWNERADLQVHIHAS